MYQRKIAQWELEKKHKAPEMKAILRLVKEREATGEPSIFRIRGRKTDIEDVYRYFRRRGEDPTKLDVRESPIPPSITVETPSSFGRPSQVETVDDDVPFEGSFLLPCRSAISLPTPGSSSGSSTRSDSDATTPLAFPDNPFAYQVIPYDPQIGRSIDLTIDDQLSRFLLHLTQLFFDAVVTQQFYAQDSANTVISKPWRRTMSSWSRATSEGHELMQGGQSDGTLVALREKAHASVEKHIKNRSPIILLRYFEIIYGLHNSPDPRDQLFLEMTLKYVLAMSGAVLPPGHPIGLLTRLLLHPQAKAIVGPLAQLGIQKSLSILFERCGFRHPRILYVLESRTQTLLDEQKYEEATTQATVYLERAQLIRNDTSYEACQARRMLGDAYVAQHQLDQAIQEYTIAFNLHRHLPSLNDRGVIGVKTKRGLAGIAKSRGNFEEAQAHLHVALQLARRSFGEEDVQVKLVQKDLRALYETMTVMQGAHTLEPMGV